MAQFKFSTKHAYDKALKKDGMRILVDRLWPRGLTKDDGHVNMWFKDVAPTTELRKWYSHDPAKWEEFKSRYMAELKEQEALIMFMLMTLPSHKVTLLYGSHEPEKNNATVLKEFLEKMTS